MAGGKNKIHEHPKAGTSTFAQRPQDINKSGANGSSITKYLKEIVGGNIVDLQITITKAGGEQEEINLNIESKGELSKALAALLIQQALGGSFKAIQEVIDRIDGKAPQTLKHEGEPFKIILENARGTD